MTTVQTITIGLSSNDSFQIGTQQS